MTIFNLKLAIFTLILSIFFTQAVFSQNKLNISGKITDKQTGEKIEFANVGIEGKNIGTISNDEGEFTLLVPSKLANKDLVVSYIGYKPFKINILNIKNNLLDIQLIPENIEIEEVVVSALTAKQLVMEAVKKIPENYSTIPYMATGFYREIAKENNKSFEIVEAVLEFFKTSYLPDEEGDQARIIKGREVVSKKPEVFEGTKVSGGPLGGISFDIVKYKGSFLEPKTTQYYEYIYATSTKYNEKPVYVIEFDQKEGVRKPLYKGKLYIDISSLAIVSCTYQFSPKGIKYLRPGLLTRTILRFAGISLEFKKIDLGANYEEHEDKWYLKNVYVDASLSLEQPKKEKKAIIDYSQSLLITERNLEIVKSIPKEQQIDRKSKIADEVGEYDEEFWKNFNIIKAGQEVKRALEDINKTEIN
jgi:hypothetical protein